MSASGSLELFSVKAPEKGRRKPGGRLERAADWARVLAGAARRVRFFRLAVAVMVMPVLQDGQLIRRPSQSLLARMGWPQVGQLKVNSFMGLFRVD